MYTTDISNLPTQKSFDYLIRSHSIDLMQSNLITDQNSLINLITSTWQTSNNLQASQIKVNLGQIQLYASVFTKYVSIYIIRFNILIDSSNSRPKVHLLALKFLVSFEPEL